MQGMWYGGHHTTKQKIGTLTLSETIYLDFIKIASKFREPILLLKFRTQLRKELGWLIVQDIWYNPHKCLFHGADVCAFST